MATVDQVMASFWSDSDYGVLAPLTDAAVRDAEEQLRVRLPPALVRLLRVRNGGTVAEQWNASPLPVPSFARSDYARFDMVMGIGRSDDFQTMLDTPYLVSEWGLPSPIVLLDGDGHSWVGLDYRSCGPRGEPTVTYFDADQEDSLLLAADFETFLAGLTAAESFW
ncbi:SMI1/KNR4 family protein [Nocardia ninae]|uniref:SMI1/KNR4 family protein n=1 Tax=Nocardia ninae NBRC 108245 TaxID=1210091 RepID=A0A511MBI7_9NOCA|nr:SMI1/KNR4 family protein [Nocardia ninae]GEM38025.1 SMI1/KNR4 family protein [Nocardia ninae NBRC 108245]